MSLHTTQHHGITPPAMSSHNRSSGRPAVTTAVTPPPVVSGATAQTRLKATLVLIKLSPEDMAWRREVDQSFKCPKKWSWAHQKTYPMRGIYLLDISGDEQHDNDSIDSEAEISLHTLSGAWTTETMRLPVSLQHPSLITLIDSGSTHCFLGAHVARHLNLSPMAKDGMTIVVANGERLPCIRVCSALPFTINSELFCINFLVIALQGYEMVRGCNWLRTLGPIVWDFSHLSMAF
jgi:hypothetical protein